MPKIEREQPSKKELLPIPYKRVTEEIFLDLFTNREKFIKNGMERFRRENSELALVAVRGSLVSPDRNIALDWALSYYEIFSRSAKKNQTLMPRVSEDLITATISESLRDAESAIDGQDQKAIQKIRENIERKKDSIRNLDFSKSPELAKFWINALLFSSQNSIQWGEFYVETVLIPLYDIAASLQRQEEVNKFSNNFRY